METRLARLARFERGWTRGKGIIALFAAYAVFTLWAQGSKGLVAEGTARWLAVVTSLLFILLAYTRRPLAACGLCGAAALSLAGASGSTASVLWAVSLLMAACDALCSLESIEPERWVSGEPPAPLRLLAAQSALSLLALFALTRPWLSLLSVAAGFMLLTYAALGRYKRAVLSLEASVRSHTAAVLFMLGGVTATLGAAVAPGMSTGVATTIFCLTAAIAVGTLEQSALVLARLTRRGAILVGLGVPLAFGASVLAKSLPGEVIAPLAMCIALALGLSTRSLERRMLPARGKLMDGLQAATAQVAKSRPDGAIRVALAALRASYEPTLRSASLWTIEPPTRITVDAAGYEQVKETHLPPGLVERLLTESRQVLRAEVLEELEVRYADCREIGQWARNLDAHAIALIALEGVAEAVLVLPRFERTEGMVLEEVEALRTLSDQLGATLSLYAQRSRGMLREQELHHRLEKLSEEASRTEHETHRTHMQHHAATSRLARPASIGFYSAAAQLAHQTLERRMKVAATMVVEVPSGSDPVPLLARTFLMGPRAHAPFVVVDGTSSLEHLVERWKDPVTSPFAQANGGMLCILDGCALPEEVQTLIAQVDREKRAPWEAATHVEFQLTITLANPFETSVQRLSSALLARLENALTERVYLPRLRERADDLRAILRERLAREGLRVRGAPVGLHDAAFAALVDYPFEGEDAELTSIVIRLLQTCTGNVVTLQDVRALQIGGGSSQIPEQVRNVTRES